MTGPEIRPVFSVIVCTRNRQATLDACLASVSAASRNAAPGSVELIVVDNASEDETSARVQAFALAAPIRVRLLREPRTGLSFARNTGMGAARGDYFIFTDDDCRLNREYFADLSRHCAAKAQGTVLGGRVDLGDPEDAPITIRTETVSALYERRHPPGGFVQGCNMVIPRGVAERVGRFDTRLGAGSSLHAAEDSDYIVRANTLGIPVEYVPDMQVFHFHGRRTPDAVRALSRNYHVGNGAIYAKHLFSAPWLLRHLYWSVRGALRELAGAPKFDVTYGISHWLVIGQSIRGMVGFTLANLAKAPNRKETPPSFSWIESTQFSE
jgi:glycosyltransferase involved in cell wall biosynthesis